MMFDIYCSLHKLTSLKINILLPNLGFRENFFSFNIFWASKFSGGGGGGMLIKKKGLSPERILYDLYSELR